MSYAASQLVADFETRTLPTPTPRHTLLPQLPGKADVVIGMRRVGKTWRLFQHMHELLASGISRPQLLYVNLEDDRFDPSALRLASLLDAWYARHPEITSQPRWLYLDEVQNAPGWERFVRRVLDTSEVQVLLTGSSSRLLSREVATSLRGRSLATELLPFSFAEVLAHRGEARPERWPLAAAERAHLVHAFRRYLTEGGFPEVQGLTPELSRRVLQDYVDVAVLRDVVERHEVRNVRALRWLVRRFLANPAGRFTANKLYRDLKSQGQAVGKDTVHELVAHLEDAHLLYILPLWTSSDARRRTNPSKAYPIDPALSRTASFAKPEDRGHHLETLVYLELRRRGHTELGYLHTEGGFEVDFCARGPGGDLQLVQVCAEMGDEATRDRELRAIEEGMAELSVERATIVTLETSETLRAGAGVVQVVPAHRWLLDPAHSG